MNREEVLEMMREEQEKVYEFIRAKAWADLTGREKDVLVDHYVLGNQTSVNVHSKLPTSNSHPPHFSTTWEGMGALLEHLQEKGLSFMENTFGELLQQSTMPACMGDDRDHRSIGELMFKLSPDAVTKAALRSVGVEINEQSDSKLYHIKAKDQELYYGGFMCFYESKNRAAAYPIDRANGIAESFNESGNEVELVECVEVENQEGLLI